MNSVFKKFWESPNLSSVLHNTFFGERVSSVAGVYENKYHPYSRTCQQQHLFMFLPILQSIKYRTSDHERYFLSKDGILDKFSYIIEIGNYFT